MLIEYYIFILHILEWVVKCISPYSRYQEGRFLDACAVKSGSSHCVAYDVALSELILKRKIRVRALLISDGYGLHRHVPET